MLQTSMKIFENLREENITKIISLLFYTITFSLDIYNNKANIFYY